ncbi:MAG TPA: right-handed parallel beta-helix repeat-containing protein [Usitatibacter sp.]|nr:right-handed parallel beta-helix repeat-containing protein [Usitatibacter sp.]
MSFTPAFLPFLIAAASAPATPSDVRAVTTYESAGLYWELPGGKEDCRVRYRRVGETDWRIGFDLWYDPRTRECRGSLVHLRPGTRYEAQLGVGDASYQRTVRFATWPEKPTVARTVKVAAGRDTLVIDKGGSAEGYVVYDGGGNTLDAGNEHAHNIVISASRVVVRNFVLRGARQDAIRITSNVSDVVIEDNDIAEWGRAGEDGGAVDLDSGIRAVCLSCPEAERITIQRNRIHDPRYGANSWSKAHPQGPQGITFSFCGGNHVIRDNEIRASGERKFNDGIGGEDNFSLTGFPNADSDIYRNRISGAWDDGIEAEGGNRNVRIWANSIDDTATGIATTLTTVGPIYIFRNVYEHSRFYEGRHPDKDSRGPFFKAGSSKEFADGRRYLFHNTMKQPQGEGARNGLGGGSGIAGTGSDKLVNNTWSINNIYQVWRSDIGAKSQVGRDNEFENDIEAGPGAAVAARARDRGRRLPNFNDDFKGKAPDIGADEAG